MLHTKTYIFLCILLISLAGCQSGSDNRVDPRLTQVEQLIDSNYEATYAILKKMPLPADHFSRSVWATLITEVRDKKNLSLGTSIPLMKSAVQYFDENKKGTSYQAKAHYYLGVCYQDADKFASALNEYCNVIPFAEKDKDYPVIFKVKCNIAYLLICCNMMNEADSIYKSIMPLAEKLHDDDGISICLFQRGRILSYDHKPAKAYPFYLRALPLCKRAGNKQMEAYIYYALAACNLEFNKPLTAQKYLRNCKKVLPDFNDCLVYLTQADIYRQINKVDSAIIYYRKSEHLSFSLESKKEIYQGLVKTYEKKGDLAKQIYYNKLYDRYKDLLQKSMQTENSAKIIREIMINQTVNSLTKTTIIIFLVVAICILCIVAIYKFIVKPSSVSITPNDDLQKYVLFKNNSDSFAKSELYAILVQNMNYNKNVVETNEKKYLTDDMWEELEKAVSEMYPHLIPKLKEVYNLKDVDIRFCCLYCLGIPDSQFECMLGYTIQSINRRKRSIRESLKLDPSLKLSSFFCSYPFLRDFLS